MDDLEELGSNGWKPNFTWFWQNLVLHGLGLFLWGPFYQFIKSIKQNGSWISSWEPISTRLVSQENKHRVANLWKPNECQPQLSTVYQALGYFTAKCNSQVRNLQAIYSLSRIEVGGMAREMAGTPQTTCTCLSFLGKLMRFRVS